MLVLSRRGSESIRIGEGITITVVKIDRNQVRIGVEAPTDVAIVREELLPGARAAARTRRDRARLGAGA